MFIQVWQMAENIYNDEEGSVPHGNAGGDAMETS